MKRLSLILMCFATATLAYAILHYWSERNAPDFLKFERLWRDDIESLEISGKLPPQWSDVGELEITGGTPETKNWLRRIEVPVKIKKENGGHKLEVLVVAWEEEGVRGVLVQYNLVDKKSGNMIFELGRTLELSQMRRLSLQQALGDFIK